MGTNLEQNAVAVAEAYIDRNWICTHCHCAPAKTGHICYAYHWVDADEQIYHGNEARLAALAKVVEYEANEDVANVVRL